MAALLAATGCTGGTTVGSTGTVSLTTSASPTAAAATRTSATPTPVTPDGLQVGPGVTDTTISLGLIVSSPRDRGFSAGIRLWQRSVNTTGGVCGRTVAVVGSTAGERAGAAYDGLARDVLGFVALPDPDDEAGLAVRSSADRMPVLLASGSSADLTTTGPVILGATDDITTINALSYLRSTARIADRGVVDVVTDGSADSANALAGARWWVARSAVSLQVRSATNSLPAGWDPAPAVLALTDAAGVRRILAATPAAVTVVTTLDGYDPTQISQSDAGRLLVMISTPAFGSDHPAAAAVAKAFTQLGLEQPGPRLLAGYAVGVTWGRLLTQACADQALTRAGVDTALSKVGPASVDSLFGPSDPAQVVNSGLPATRLSSMAQADPGAPGGLKPLIWMQAAPGIGDYTPTT